MEQIEVKQLVQPNSETGTSDPFYPRTHVDGLVGQNGQLLGDELTAIKEEVDEIKASMTLDPKIVDNLGTPSVIKSLSANQGVVIDTRLKALESAVESLQQRVTILEGKV